MKRLRVYADTSVFGGCFDPEFETASTAFFREVAKGRFVLVVAEVTTRELGEAPEKVREVLARLPKESVQRIPFSEEIGRLRDAYIEAGVLGRASTDDAEHVASASVAEVDLLISWNFKHVVHFDKIAGFEAVNLLHGYRPVRIYSPREVVQP
jgi:hypothetical protein